MFKANFPTLNRTASPIAGELIDSFAERAC